MVRWRDDLGAPCYLSFLPEDHWCGNIRQSVGLTIAALSRNRPQNRAEAEESTLLLVENWAANTTEWIEALPRVIP